MSVKNVEQNVNAVSINPDADLVDQRAELSKLNQNDDEFEGLFKVNFFIKLEGIRRIA